MMEKNDFGKCRVTSTDLEVIHEIYLTVKKNLSGKFWPPNYFLDAFSVFLF